MLESIKKAKLLKEQGVTIQDIESKIGIARAYIPKLLELYELMSNMQKVDDKNSEYVRIKKKRYMMQSIKLQHKMNDLRDKYLKSREDLKEKYEKIREYMDKAEDIHDLKKELFYIHKMLDVTSSNLQHAEDGYEYIKRESMYSKLTYFIYGVGGGLLVALLMRYFGVVGQQFLFLIWYLS